MTRLLGKYETVKQNVENLCILRNKRTASSPMNVMISTILHEGSKEDFAKSLNMWRNIKGGVNMVLVRTMNGSTQVSSDSYEEYISNDLVSRDGFTPSCTIFGKSMQILANGDLYICCIVNEQTRLGNIFETNITEILNSEKFKKLVNAFHWQYRDVPEYCKRCALSRSLAKL